MGKYLPMNIRINAAPKLITRQEVKKNKFARSCMMTRCHPIIIDHHNIFLNVNFCITYKSFVGKYCDQDNVNNTCTNCNTSILS